jgi:hypothetical protein
LLTFRRAKAGLLMEKVWNVKDQVYPFVTPPLQEKENEKEKGKNKKKRIERKYIG